MNSQPVATPWEVVRKVCLFALIGFGFVFLAGPIGVILGFALVGFLVWVAINMAVNGARSTGEGVGRLFRGIIHAFTGIFRLGARGVTGVIKLPKRAWDKTWKVGGNTFVWTFEIVSGLLAGALIGAIYDKGTNFVTVAILFGGLVGALLGAWIAHWQRKSHGDPYALYPDEL